MDFLIWTRDLLYYVMSTRLWINHRTCIRWINVLSCDESTVSWKDNAETTHVRRLFNFQSLFVRIHGNGLKSKQESWHCLWRCWQWKQCFWQTFSINDDIIKCAWIIVWSQVWSLQENQDQKEERNGVLSAIRSNVFKSLTVINMVLNKHFPCVIYNIVILRFNTSLSVWIH